MRSCPNARNPCVNPKGNVLTLKLKSVLKYIWLDAGMVDISDDYMDSK